MPSAAVPVVVTSVTNAAGGNPFLEKESAKILFVGTNLAPDGALHLNAVVDKFRAVAGPLDLMLIRVNGDPGLSPSRQSDQIRARMKVLRIAIVQRGLDRDRFVLVPQPKET